MVLYSVLQRSESAEQNFEIAVERKVESLMYLERKRLLDIELTPHERTLIFTVSGVPKGFSAQVLEDEVIKNDWFYSSFRVRGRYLNIVIMPRPGREQIAEALAQAFIYEIRACDSNMTYDFHTIRSAVAVDAERFASVVDILKSRATSELGRPLPWDKLRLDGKIELDGHDVFTYRLEKVA